jgi:AraC-like DNA-binding protein
MNINIEIQLFFTAFLVMLSLSVIYGILLLLKKNNYIANRLFSYIIVYSTSREILFILINIFGMKNLYTIELFVRPFDYMIGPMVILYVYNLLYNKMPGLKSFAFVSIPALVSILHYLVEVILLGTGTPDAANYRNFALRLWILIAVYVFTSFLLYLQYRRKITDFYSNIEKLKITWLKIMLLVIFSVALAGMINGILFNSYVQIGYDLLLMLSVLITWYFSLNHPQLFVKTDPSTFENGVPKTQKYEKTALSEKAVKENAAELEKTILEDELYLEPDLTMSDLSDETGLPVHHISQTINRHFESNFYTFINTYRISHAKDLLEKNTTQQILEIALESGFGSKSQFNRIFKNIVGKTPGEYRSQFTSKS